MAKQEYETENKGIPKEAKQWQKKAVAKKTIREKRKALMFEMRAGEIFSEMKFYRRVYAIWKGYTDQRTIITNENGEIIVLKNLDRWKRHFQSLLNLEEETDV